MTHAAIETRILSIYLAGSEAEAYTISELARRTGAAYPHVHAAARRMAADGLLEIRAVGRASYCSVNLADGLARNLLAQAALRRKPSALSSPNLRNLDAEVQRLAVEEPRLIAALLAKEGLRLIVTERDAVRPILRKTALLNVSFSTPDELRDELLGSMALLDGATPLLGYARLLLHLAPVHERLLLNHAALFRGKTGGRTPGKKGARR